MILEQYKRVFLLFVVEMSARAACGVGTRFSSHVTVSTPDHSYSHGVGDPLTISNVQAYNTPRRQPGAFRSRARGYPRIRPTIPFDYEEGPGPAAPRVPFSTTVPLQLNNMEIDIPLLSVSPYKVNSPDPESLWPQGVFLPPLGPRRFGINNRRSDANIDPFDPYLLEGSAAIAAVARAKNHGELYFHDIPHIQSLFENQQLRVQNNLEPHIVGSIRHTWPYNRP